MSASLETLLPTRKGQSDVMTVCHGPDVGLIERGHWYSPAAVCTLLDAAKTARREIKQLDDPCGVASTELGRCGTCKHWQRYTKKVDVEYHGVHAGICNSDRFVYGARQPLVDGFRYWDYKGYSTGFDTGERFGCVNWAAA